MTDPKERSKVIRQFEKRVLDEKAYQFHVLWWQRIVALEQIERLEDHSESLRQPRFKGCLDRAVIDARKRMEDRG
jgi:hypothetical protein